MVSTDDILSFPDAAAFEEWLAGQHDTSTGIWLKLARGDRAFAYSHALDVALCYGWIDGQKKSLDEQHWLQRFTPRRPDSKWSKVNRHKAITLVASGRMQPAGQREIERAQADGRWDAAYDGMRTAPVPDDLAAALAAHPSAADFFATLGRRNRYSVLYRIQDAKKPETRARRIAQYVEMLGKGETIH